MAGFSIWHWLIVLIWLSSLIAIGKILKRLGFSPFLSILAIVPILNLVMLWVLALVAWPIEERNGATSKTFE